MFSIMRLNEIIAVERSIRPLSTACAEIKLPCSFVSQVAFVQVNQTAAALYYLPSSQLGLFFFQGEMPVALNSLKMKLPDGKANTQESFLLVGPVV